MNGISDHVNSTPESLDMGDALIGPAACGCCPNPDSLKRRASARALSLLNMAWTSLKSLLALVTLSRFRNCALQRAPVRWTLASEPTIWRSLRPCQSRNITEQRIQRLQSRGQLSPWRHAAVSSLHTRATEEARTDHVTPETKNWTHAENEAKTSILLKPTQASITN